MGDLLDLRTLGISSNKLSSLPASLGQLALLEFLFANGNRLHSLPAELAGLMNLKKVLYAVSVRERGRERENATPAKLCCYRLWRPWPCLCFFRGKLVSPSPTAATAAVGAAGAAQLLQKP